MVKVVPGSISKYAPEAKVNVVPDPMDRSEDNVAVPVEMIKITEPSGTVPQDQFPAVVQDWLEAEFHVAVLDTVAVAVALVAEAQPSAETTSTS